jgi:hypothetical protein
MPPTHHHDDPPKGDSNQDDEYAGFDEEVERIQQLFRERRFSAMERARNEADPIRVTRAQSPNGSIGRALALGMANVFDPDRVRDDVVAVQEKGEGDPDVPDTSIDPNDPTTTRVVYRSR